jgi:prepilin-type N-terminal cleavage/methylation domain-containing protein
MAGKGFTLVEMMVAIAVFSIVMVAAMSALLNVIDANNKARAIKTAINNISFALEGISKDMRMGTDYACGDSGNEPNGDCTGGGDTIKYRSIRADIDGDKYKYAYYQFRNNQILSCLQKDLITCGSPADFSPITSSEVELTRVRFYVLGSASNLVVPNKKQPRMIITVKGKAGIKDKISTEFDLQTSVSQTTK